jgi:hypothetical protein
MTCEISWTRFCGSPERAANGGIWIANFPPGVWSAIGIEIEFEKPIRDPDPAGFKSESKRWIVERTFAWLNFYRRVATDYEHTTHSTISFLFMENISMVPAKIASYERSSPIKFPNMQLTVWLCAAPTFRRHGHHSRC